MGSNKKNLIIDLNFQINTTLEIAIDLGRTWIGCSTSEAELKKIEEWSYSIDSKFKIYTR